MGGQRIMGGNSAATCAAVCGQTPLAIYDTQAPAQAAPAVQDADHRGLGDQHPDRLRRHHAWIVDIQPQANVAHR
jgi:hypothetical protein